MRSRSRGLTSPGSRLYADFKATVSVDKGLVYAVLRSNKKITNAFSEPTLLAASMRMKFKRSGNDLVLYEPKAKE